MKKVLIIAAALYIGGAERVCRNIGYYSGDRFEVHYVVFGDKAEAYEAELLAKGCRIFHTDPPSKSYKAYYRYLISLIRKERYDVIHAHTMFNSGWAMLAGKHCGVPVRIAHSHSSLVTGRNLKKTGYEMLMRRMILNNTTACVACGQKAGERLYGHRAFAKRGIKLLNGIDADAFAFDPRQRERIRRETGLQDRFVIGHTGRLDGVKNQSFLIRLMPQILRLCPQACLLLLGDGADRPKLERLIGELGLQEQVRMPGSVTNVNEYLSAMDVFAFPSLFEGMPLSIVEVQANGLPCVLSDGVPHDVFATDLITQLPLSDEQAWIKEILGASRAHPESYAEAVKEKGMGIETFLQTVYRLYDGDEAQSVRA